jgi:hypothetical protein
LIERIYLELVMAGLANAGTERACSRLGLETGRDPTPDPMSRSARLSGNQTAHELAEQKAGNLPASLFASARPARAQ